MPRRKGCLFCDTPGVMMRYENIGTTRYRYWLCEACAASAVLMARVKRVILRRSAWLAARN